MNEEQLYHEEDKVDEENPQTQYNHELDLNIIKDYCVAYIVILSLTLVIGAFFVSSWFITILCLLLGLGLFVLGTQLLFLFFQMFEIMIILYDEVQNQSDVIENQLIFTQLNHALFGTRKKRPRKTRGKTSE